MYLLIVYLWKCASWFFHLIVNHEKLLRTELPSSGSDDESRDIAQQFFGKLEVCLLKIRKTNDPFSTELLPQSLESPPCPTEQLNYIQFSVCVGGKNTFWPHFCCEICWNHSAGKFLHLSQPIYNHNPITFHVGLKLQTEKRKAFTFQKDLIMMLKRHFPQFLQPWFLMYLHLEKKGKKTLCF